MCFRLWKIDYNVNNVLKLLPKVLCSTEKAYQETSNEFSHIRLLVTKVPQVKRQVPTISLERPLFDFLRQIQIIFDIGKHLEEIIVNVNMPSTYLLHKYTHLFPGEFKEHVAFVGISRSHLYPVF